jgi:signal transduction histidine kinase
MAVPLTEHRRAPTEHSAEPPGSLRKRMASLAALIAHEARSPLATVSGYASLLQQFSSHFSPEQREAMLEEIQAESARLSGLISELAALYAQPLPRRGRLRQTDLVRALSPLARRRLVHLELAEPAGRFPPVLAAPRLLRGALQRLVSLHACPGSLPQLRLEVGQDAVHLELTVAAPAQPEDSLLPSPEGTAHMVFARWVALLHGSRLYQDELSSSKGKTQRIFRMALRVAACP